MDEVRVWKVARTAEQIRANLFRTLTGKEPDLAGYWNFDDPTQPAKDATTNGHHGVLRGNAKVSPAPRPSESNLSERVKPAFVYGKVLDEASKPLLNVRIRVEQDGQQIAQVNTDAKTGQYSLVFNAADKPFDLEARSDNRDGELGAWKPGVKANPVHGQEINWVLKSAPSLSGAVRSLADTPMIGVVVQALRGEVKGSQFKLQSDGATDGTRALTSTNGVFKFSNLKPGSNQIRCQVPGGFVAYTNVVIVTADSENRSDGPVQPVHFQLAPFKKGNWQGFNYSHGLAHYDLRSWANISISNGWPSFT
ncbi:MAG: carboxypeptidase regulatory-like domain-containing protein [Pedosphaera sp.]|nr:carboxypeptidase regulatory-like domain-containing protein [Pedosphaera sp.]